MKTSDVVVASLLVMIVFFPELRFAAGLVLAGWLASACLVNGLLWWVRRERARLEAPKDSK